MISLGWVSIGMTRTSALAVGDVALYKETYAPLLMQPITVPSPDCYHRETGESWSDYSTRMFAHMEAALAQHANEVCAVIVEPLLQGAGGMIVHDRHDFLLPAAVVRVEAGDAETRGLAQPPFQDRRGET